jgi:hypothetical protein
MAGKVGTTTTALIAAVTALLILESRWKPVLKMSNCRFCRGERLVEQSVVVAQATDLSAAGPVRVTGSDPYDLDRDGDGRAFEWS